MVQERKEGGSVQKECYSSLAKMDKVILGGPEAVETRPVARGRFDDVYIGIS